MVCGEKDSKSKVRRKVATYDAEDPFDRQCGPRFFANVKTSTGQKARRRNIRTKSRIQKSERLAALDDLDDPKRAFHLHPSLAQS
jgi:hypothetical protein